MSDTRPKIIVIGAGIIGSSIAYYLSRNRAAVTLIDDGTSPAGQASGCSFGWINANTPENGDYFKFRMVAIGRWQALASEVKSLPVRFTGSLDWDMPEDTLATTLEQYGSLGYPSKLVSRDEIQALAPALKNPPEAALHNLAEGIADPARIARAFKRMAVENGATLCKPARVTGFQTGGSGVNAVRTEDGNLDCNAAIICTGVQTPELLAPLGLTLPMTNRRGLLIKTPPLPDVGNLLISSPSLHFWQHEDGSILAGKNQAGDVEETKMTEAAAEICDQLQAMLGMAIDLSACAIISGTRPVPGDGFPAVGTIGAPENLFMAVMHSGITLAPLIGEELASEVLGGDPSDLLASYRPHRLLAPATAPKAIAC